MMNKISIAELEQQRHADAVNAYWAIQHDHNAQARVGSKADVVGARLYFVESKLINGLPADWRGGDLTMLGELAA